MATIPSLHALLIEELQDLYHAEKQLLRALPGLAKAAGTPALKGCLTGHLADTRKHLTRLSDAFQSLALPARGKTCQAMRGLLEESADVVAMKAPPAVRDAALIGSVQRVEHYAMAGYGTARAFAYALGEEQVAKLLQATLDEVGAANRALTTLSHAVNAEARSAAAVIEVPRS